MKLIDEYRKFMETSKWIKSVGGNGWNEWDNLKCPYCGAEYEKVAHPTQYKYCPNCGCAMTKEREDDK